ncbi:MAG: hypothetical protein WCR49_11315 [Opitutae bacterium]
MFLRPQFWAEDGAIFFVQADVEGARALLAPYGGYHHLLLRIIAALVAPLNAALLPAAYFSVTMAITFALATAVFSARIELAGRTACALALGLLPHSGEAIGNLTNLQWPAALGLVWLLLARDASRPRQHLGDLLLAGVLGLTGVFSMLFAPLFLYRAVRRRSPASWTLAGLIFCMALVQFVTVCRTADAGSPAESAWSGLQVMQTVGLRLPGALCLPVEWAARLPVAAAASLGLGCAVLLLVAACWPGRQQETRLLLAACVALVLAGTLFRFRQDPGPLAVLSNGDRYFILPKLLVTWLLIQGLGQSDWRRYACAVVCLAILSVSLANWRYERIPNLHWVDYAQRIEAGENIPVIPLNPAGCTFSHPGRHQPR